ARQLIHSRPIEMLGVAAGMALPPVPDEHRQWLSGTIVRGLAQSQFRTRLSRLAAHAALFAVDETASRKQSRNALDVNALGNPDLALAAAIHLAFDGPVTDDVVRVEHALMSRALKQPIPIGDAADAAAVAVLAGRAAERAALRSDETSPEDRIITLCQIPAFRRPTSQSSEKPRAHCS